MKEFIIQAVIIIMWAVLFREVLVAKFLNWLYSFTRFISLIEAARKTTKPKTIKQLGWLEWTYIGYYAFYGCCAFNLFGDYSISIAAIVTGITALLMLLELLSVWFLERRSDEEFDDLIDMIESESYAMYYGKKQNCNYGEEGNI